MQVIFQKPTDLVLAIVEGELSSPLTVLKQTTLAAAQYRFVFSILGESHMVRVEHENGLIFHEVLACSELVSNNPVHYHRFNDLKAYRYHRAGYNIAISFEVHRADRLLPASAETSLEVQFPETHGRIPVTRVEWQATETAMSWRTVHLYPTDRRATSVVSESIFWF